MELEICTKTLHNFSEKLREKFPLSTLCLSMVSSSCLICASAEILLLERSLVEGQTLQQKERKKRKRKNGKKSSRMVYNFLSKNSKSRGVNGLRSLQKKSMTVQKMTVFFIWYLYLSFITEMETCQWPYYVGKWPE